VRGIRLSAIRTSDFNRHSDFGIRTCGHGAPRLPLDSGAGAASLSSVKRGFLIWGAICALFFDQLTKIIIHGMYRAGAFSDVASIRLIGDILRVSYEKNQHGVFGLVYGPHILYILLPLTVAGVVLFLGVKERSAWAATAYGIIFGGAIGNVIDRIRIGYVIDFIVFELRSLNFRWYTFNLADAAVLTGVVMLLIKEFFFRPRKAGVAAPPAEPATTSESKPA
jgi:signal peptidase II